MSKYRHLVQYRVGDNTLLVTERAVFEVAPEGLVLTEIAPGVDVARDVLGQMAFAPHRIVDPLPLMDAALFDPEPRAPLAVEELSRNEPQSA